MEAEGIEPSSQDNRNGGLYMLSRWFDLVSRADRRHPARDTSRLYLAARPTTESRGQPDFFSQRFTDVNAVPRPPGLLGGHCELGLAEANPPSDITVIGS